MVPKKAVSKKSASKQKSKLKANFKDAETDDLLRKLCKLSIDAREEASTFSSNDEIRLLLTELFRRYNDGIMELGSEHDEKSIEKLYAIMSNEMVKQGGGGWTHEASLRWSLSLMKSPDMADEAMSSLLHIFQDFGDLKHMTMEVLEVLTDKIENEYKKKVRWDIAMKRLKCLLTIVDLMDVEYIPIVERHIFDMLKQDLKADDVSKPKVLLAVLDIVHAISVKHPPWIRQNLGYILGISLTFMTYGLPHHSNVISVSVTRMLLLNSGKHETCAPPEKEKEKKRKKRRPRNQYMDKINLVPMDDVSLPPMSWMQSSESERSDEELTKDMKEAWKSNKTLRLSALTLLLLLVKTNDNKLIVSYWDVILDGPHSLLETIKVETSPRIVVTLSTILTIMFVNGKMYYAQAQHNPRNKSAPYTSWSHKLAELIEHVHSTLLVSISVRHPSVSRICLLRCLATVVRYTPYHRLQRGLLSMALKAIYFLYHSDNCADSQVRVSALKCLTEVITKEPQVEEQRLLLKSHDITNKNLECQGPSWIANTLVEILETDSPPSIIRGEIWVVLGALAKHFFQDVLAGKLTAKVCALLPKHLKERMLQLNAARAFEHFAAAISATENSGVDCFQVWLSLLDNNGPLVPLLQNLLGELTAAACDCISNMTNDVFEKLPERLRIFIVTTLYGIVLTHPNHTARSAAVRTLGILVLFPFLASDIQIIYDVADRVVLALKDDNLMVRTNAAWALGNLADVLLKGRDAGIPIQEVPLVKLLTSAVKTGMDSEKVKSCSMRAMGILVLLLDEKHMDSDKKWSLVTLTADTLIENAATESSMKVRWNACYALSNMLRNYHLSRIPLWKGRVFETLCSLLEKCSNFKVRCAAAHALMAPKLREDYGSFYIYIWPFLLKGYENCSILPNFSEYKHQHNLYQQLNATFFHLSSLLTEEDLREPYLVEVFKVYWDTASQYIKPNGPDFEQMDKSCWLVWIKAKENVLGSLGKLKDLSRDEKNILSYIIDTLMLVKVSEDMEPADSIQDGKV